MEQKVQQVLCVEDNTENQLLLRLYIKNQPWKISFADDGHTAIELLEKGWFDLFLVDLNLPNGMDGFEVARKIRKHPVHKDKPIVIISGFSKSDITEADEKPFINQYLTKPVRKSDFINTLGAFLKD